MVVLFFLLGLVALYLWLRGWWFAGLLAGFLYRYWQAPDPRSWFWTIVVAAGPWLFWQLVTPRGRRVLGDAIRAMDAQAEADRLRKAARRRPNAEWLALPRAERARRNAEWRAAHAGS